MNARRLAVAAFLANLALLVAWYGAISPVAGPPRALVLGLILLPALPALITLANRRRSAAFWAALAALIWFSHGVMEFWTDPATRTLAGIEILFSVIVIVAASWNGLHARFGRRS